MKMSYRWLERHLPELSRVPSHVVVEAFVHLGIEVASVDAFGAPFKTVEVVRVVDRRRHPGADHLHVLTVMSGAGDSITVVTGADNGERGDRVWYAPPGTLLADGRVLASIDIHGVQSSGMVISASEMGFSDPISGLWLAPPNLELGSTLLSALGGEDLVFDLELTPNLAAFDQSAIGLARDLAAYFGWPQPELPRQFNFSSTVPMIGTVDSLGAPLYGAVLLHIKPMTPSPLWMQALLLAIGQRTISPLVDFTNFVLWDLGQPLHVFDYDQLSLPMAVRQAYPGERLTTLDGVDRQLASEDLVIADAKHALALAGIMGGQKSGVGPETRRVLLESAHFDAPTIYRGLRRHRVESDAALHFGKGTDPKTVLAAPTLIAEVFGDAAIVENSQIVGTLREDRRVEWDGKRVRSLLGVDWSDEIMLDALGRLGFVIDLPSIIIPSFRPDVEALHDLSEEILRVLGIDQVPTRRLSGEVFPGRRTVAADHLFRLAQAWADAGFWEVVTSAFQSGPEGDHVGGGPKEPITIVNPLRPEDGQLRQSLLPGLLQVVTANRARSDRSLEIFEMAPVFWQESGRPVELYQLAVVQTLEEVDASWPKRAPSTIVDLKEHVAWVWKRLGIQDKWHMRPAVDVPAWAHPGRLLAIYDSQGKNQGVIAEVKPKLAQALRVKRLGVVLWNLLDVGDWDHMTQGVKRPSRYPAATRDLSLVPPPTMPFGFLEEVVEQALAGAASTIPVEFWLVDRYRLENGCYSLTLRFVLQSHHQTLGETEIASVLDAVMSHASRHGITARQ